MINKLPDRNIRILRISEQEILEILCDYFLGDNLEGYSDWYAQIIKSDGSIEFAAVYGFEGDIMYEEMIDAIRQKAQQTQ